LAEDPSASDLIYLHKYFQIFSYLFPKIQKPSARAAETLGIALRVYRVQRTYGISSQQALGINFAARMSWSFARRG
jgi:hypothetical protein